MNKAINFKEVAIRYLNKPTKKLGRVKNPNAYSTLEWMYERRPAMILIKGRNKPVPYGRKNKEHSHTVVSWDETSGRFADLAMRDIANRDVDDMETDLRSSKGLSNAGINTYLVYLRAVCNYAQKKLDVAFVKFPKIETLPTEGRDYYLTPEIAKDWMQFLDPLRLDMVKFGLAVGQRKSNIVNLKWTGVSRDLTKMFVEADEAKNGHSHIVQLNAMGVQVLKKRREDRIRLMKQYPKLGDIEYVFVQEDIQHLGQPMQPNSMTGYMWERSINRYNDNLKYRALKHGQEVDIAKKIPKGKLVFHTLRHSFATWLNEAGTDLDDIALVGGWKSLDACRRYVKKSEDRAREVSSRIPDLF